MAPARAARFGRRSEGQIVIPDFKLWANCDLRTAATQCGLSHQEVPMPQTPRLTQATARGRARSAGGGLRERNQGGR